MKLKMIVKQKEGKEEKRKYPYFGQDRGNSDIVLFLSSNRGLFFGNRSDLLGMAAERSISIEEIDFDVVKGTITFEQS